MPPTLTSKPTEAFLGGSKRFKCQVIGNPRPVIRWFKDGVDITNNPRFSFDFTMEGRISMVIPNVTYKDEGCYRCRAENSEGIASTASYLMVRGSVQEQRDEIPSTDVAEMEIEEVYIKKRDERSFVEEMSESSRKRSEKKDRWKESEIEIKEEMSMSSSSYQKDVHFESSHGEMTSLDKRQWQMESESDLSTIAESESGFVFDGQSLVIESQVLGNTQELLANLDENASAKVKPIFVDTRKRPSDELEAEDVIELVVQEEERNKSNNQLARDDDFLTDQNLELFIDEENIITTETQQNDNKVLFESSTDSSLREVSREVTMTTEISEEGNITGESHNQIKTTRSSSEIKTATSESFVEEITSDNLQKDKNKKKEETLMEKMEKFKDEREEEVELFISEETSEKEIMQKTFEEKKLSEEERREQTRKADLEKQEKARQEEEEKRKADLEKQEKARQEEEKRKADLEKQEKARQEEEEKRKAHFEKQEKARQEEEEKRKADLEKQEKARQEEEEKREQQRKADAEKREKAKQEEEEKREQQRKADAEKREKVKQEEEEKREQKRKADAEKREKARQEEEAAMLEKIRKFKKLKDEEEEGGNLFSKSLEVTDESDQGQGAISESGGKKVELEEFYNKETSFEGDVEVSREERRVFSFESEISNQNFEQVTTESSSEFVIETSVDIDETSSKRKTDFFEIGADIEIDEVAIKNEEDRLNEKNKKLSALEQEKVEETKLKEISGQISTEEVSITAESTRNSVVETDTKSKDDNVLLSVEVDVQQSEVSSTQKGLTMHADVSTEETKLASIEREASATVKAEIETEEKLFDDEKSGLGMKFSVDLDGTAYGEKADLETSVKVSSTHEFSSSTSTISATEETTDTLKSDRSVEGKAEISEDSPDYQKAKQSKSLEFSAKETVEERDSQSVSSLPDEDARQAKEKDVDGIAEGVKTRPKLTAEASVGEDDTELEAVVDVKETQTEKGDLNEVQIEKSALGIEGGVATKVAEDLIASEAALSIETQKEVSLVGKSESESLTATKASQEELKSDLLLTESNTETLSDLSLNISNGGDVAVKKDVPSVAKGIKSELEECKTSLQEGETVLENISGLEANVEATADQSDSNLGSELISQRRPEYKVDAEETESDQVSVIDEKKTSMSQVSAEAEMNQTELSKTEKSLSLVGTQSEEIDLFISEDLEAVKKESVNIDGIAEGEKNQSKTESPSESKVALSSVDGEDMETEKIGDFGKEKLQVETVAQEKAIKKSAESLVEEQATESETVTDVQGTQSTEAGQSTFELSVDATVEVKSKEETKVEVQSSVDSLQYAGSLDQSDVDIKDANVTESAQDLLVTSEISVSASEDTPQISSESCISESQKLTEEEEKLDLQVDVTTDSKSADKEAEVLGEKLELSATVETKETIVDSPVSVEVDTKVETVGSEEVLSVSAETDVSETSKGFTISAEVDVSETKTPVASAKVDLDNTTPVEDVPVSVVSEEPLPTPPEIVSGPSEISVQVGQTINIEVTLSGFPAPQISWTKDYRKVEESKNIKMTVQGDVYCLQILNTVIADAGKYRLTASNSEGRVTFDVKVKVEPAKVKAKEEDETKSSKLQTPEKFPPKIEGPADISVEVGQTLMVELTVKGNPTPRLSWYKGSKPIFPNYRTKTIVDGEVYTLQILNTVEADAGSYRATAVNQKGEESWDVKVTVTLPTSTPEPSKDENIEASVTVEENEEKERPSEISAEVEVEEKSKPSEISAKVDEKSKPSEISAEVEINEKSKQSEISAEVEIAEKSKPSEISAEVEINEKSKQSEISAEVEIDEKSKPTEISAEVEIDEKSKPTEISAEVEIDEKSKPSEISAEVEVEKSKPSEISAEVEIDKKSKPSEISAEVKIDEPDEPLPTPPEIVNGPSDISVQAGQTINIEVNISGFPAPQVSWTKDYRKVEESKNIKMTVQGDVYCLQILNTVIADAGKYRLTASNSEGRVTFDVKVKVEPAKANAKEEDETKLTKSQTPEKFSPKIVAPANVTVDVGQTLTVEINVKGNPTPRLSWYKGSKPIFPNYRTKTIVDGEVYTLQILNTVEADAGSYRATAVNQKGEESCDVMVTVTLPEPPTETSTGEDTETSVSLKEMEPPSLTSKPESKSVTEGEPVTLSATVTGKPLPTVTWFKNNTLLKTGYNCRLHKQGRTHFVQIASAEIFDSGRYSLCVENPAGAVFWTITVDVEAATEQESSGSTIGEETISVTEDLKTRKQSEETPDELFLKEYVVLSDYKDVATDFTLKKDDCVEVLDTLSQDKWLVRKKDDKEKVCYVPVDLLLCLDTSSEETVLKSRKRSESRKMSEDAGASSGEEEHGKIREFFPLYVAVADYNPPEGDTVSLKLSEGQFVEVMDMDKTDKWLVRTKPTKNTPAKQGWVPSSYFEEKNSKMAAARSSRETFREDIIKISNKQQEALVKRRYVLTDLLETEREYINQLNSVVECFQDNMYKQPKVPEALRDKRSEIFANLKDLQELHSKILLPALTNCTMSPASVGKVFTSKKSDFEKYIPYGCSRDNAESILAAEDVKVFLKEYNRKSGSEQVLPECLRRPINRLYEYQAVLKDILKYTSRAGEECSQIENAIHMISEILRRIDDVKMLRTIEGYPGDITDLGPIIRHDDLQLWSEEPEGRGKDRHVFLFPEKVVFVKKKKDGTGFLYKSTSELQDIQINENVPSDDRRFELWFAEPTSEKLTLQAKSLANKQNWTQDVREALKALGVEETDISPEQQKKVRKSKSPSPAKTQDKVNPEGELKKGETTEEDYLSFDSLDSDVSSYHTAPEFDDGSSLPVFKKRLRKTVVKEGEKVRLECTVGGRPLPSVAWQKGVFPIRHSDETQILVDGAHNSLVLPDAIREDSGVYTAKATNKNGSAVCSAEVKVGEGIDQSTDQEYMTAQSALSSDGEVTLPAKMGQMDSCLVEEGRTARFDCNLTADPKPEIMWLKDGKILTSSKKYEVLNPRDDLHSLIVHDVTKADSGRYVCWARNEFGEAFTEAYLNIIPTQEAEEEVERIAPKITKKFYDCVGVNGQNVEVKFKFIGSPKPHIQWYLKNKEILPPRDYDLSVEGDQCTFLLKEVQFEDAGKIIVKLTNPVGEASCSAQLTVIEDFSKPRVPPKVAPKFITKFTDVDVNEGFEARFKAKVMGEPLPTVTWLRNGLPLKDCPRYKYEEYGEILILIIEKAESGDAGEYTCHVKNKAGEASCQANLTVTKVKIPQVSDNDATYKSLDYGYKGRMDFSSKKESRGANGEMGPQFGYAPVFTKMIQDCDTKEGRRAQFECRAYGMPEPAAAWTHNGVPLERGPRFIMSKDEESNYHLMIKDVLPTDAGQYTCRLSNFAGKATCSAQLRVEALPRKDTLRLSPERGVEEEVTVQKKVIPEPPSMPDQKPVLLDKTVDSARLSWLPAHVPIKSQGAKPIQYIIESRELPKGDWRRMASGIADTTYVARQLNPNAEYLFRVRAENDNGMSAPTQPAVLEIRAPKVKKAEKDARLEASKKGKTDMMGLSTESATGPSFPTDKPTLLDIRPESVRIQWVPVTVPGPGSDYRAVKYLLEVKEIPGPWRKLEGGLTGNSYFATDLNPDREYNFRVRAENKFGESEPTLPATLPRGRVVPPALQPYKPYASDIGAESLRLSWKPADVPKELKGVSPTSYRIEVQELPRPDWQSLVSYIPDTSYRLTDLKPDQDYNFRIRAENEFGLSEPSRPFYLQRALTYPGAAVTRPDIVELEPSAVRLNWERVEIPQFELDEEPLTYMIEGRTPASDWRELVRGVRGTSHYLSGLQTNEDLSFRVRPDLGPRGLGEPSPPMALSRALARTRVPVSDLEIEELEPTSARLQWDRVHIPPFDSSDEPLLYMIECQEGPYANWRTLASGVPTTNFRVSDLKPDKDYAFRVRAETEYGISEPSPPKPLYRRQPEAPRYHLEPPRIEPFDADSLQLSWKPISPHPQIRRADPPKYTIEMREAAQADWRPVAAGIPDTSFRLSGLRPEQDYTFRVRAEMSRFPEPVALMTPSVSLIRGGVPPVMPSSAPTISNEKPNSLRLSWRPASLPSYLTGDIGPIRYRVEAQEGPNSSEWRTLASRLSEPFFEVTKLHPEREYSFRVRAETESGNSAPTAPAYLYRKPVPHLPKAEPLLSDIRPDSVRLTWQSVDVPGRAIDFQRVNYLIEMQEPPSQSWVPFVRDVHEINHIIHNLRPDKDYVFRVRAVTEQGMSEPTMSVYLPRRAVHPRMPLSEPYISDVKPDSAKLSWTPVDTPPFGALMAPTTYRVEIMEPPNNNWQTLVRKLPTTNYVLTNLRPDKMYSLRVRAENEYGVSEPTRAIQLPRRAVAPVVPNDVPMVSDVRGGSMRLTWQPARVPSYGGSTVNLPVTYTIEAREPGRDWTPLVRRIPHTSYFLSGLRPDGDYEFRVRAESQYGLSPPGPSSSLPRQQVARIPIQTPQIIDIQPDGRGLVLQWQRANIPSGSGSELITYVIEAQEPPSMEWSPVGRGVMDTKYRVTGLRPNQDYLFRVRAQTGQGLSEPTLPVTFYRRLISPRVPVERPQLYDLEADAVRLSWQPTATYQSETPMRYTVEVREPQIKKWRPLVRSLPDTSYHVTGLKPKLDYEFRVRPETDKGLLEPTPSIPLYRKRVLPPLRFEEPRILEDEPESVSLRWQRVTVPKFESQDEELTYMIEAQKGPTLDWEPIARNIRDTSYRVTGLGPHEDYQFRIRGESRDFGFTDPSPPLPLYRKPSKALSEVSNLVFVISDPVVKYPFSSDSKKSKDPTYDKPPKLHSNLASTPMTPQLPRRARTERRPSVDLGSIQRSSMPSPQFARRARRGSVAVERPAFDRDFNAKPPKAPLASSPSPQLGRSSRMDPGRRGSISMETRPSITSSPMASPQVSRRSRLDMPRRGSVTMDRRPSVDLGQSEKQRGSLMRLQSLQEGYKNLMKWSSTDKLSATERRQSVDRTPATGRRPSTERRPSVDMSSSSVSRLQRWSSVDHMSSLDRRPLDDSSASLTRRSSIERWSSIDRLSDLGKVPPSPSLARRGRRFSVSGIPSHEKSSTENVPFDRNALLARGVEADRHTSSDRSGSISAQSPAMKRRYSISSVDMSRSFSSSRRASFDFQSSTLSGSKQNLSDLRSQSANFKTLSSSTPKPKASARPKPTPSSSTQNQASFSSTSFYVIKSPVVQSNTSQTSTNVG